MTNLRRLHFKDCRQLEEMCYLLVTARINFNFNGLSQCQFIKKFLNFHWTLWGEEGLSIFLKMRILKTYSLNSFFYDDFLWKF